MTRELWEMFLKPSHNIEVAKLKLHRHAPID